MTLRTTRREQAHERCHVLEIHVTVRTLNINVEHVASASNWVESVWDNYFVDALHDFSRKQGSAKSREEIAKEFYDRPDKEANILAPVETQCEWLRALGFQDVDCYFKIFELAVFGGRRPAP